MVEWVSWVALLSKVYEKHGASFTDGTGLGGGEGLISFLTVPFPVLHVIE